MADDNTRGAIKLIFGEPYVVTGPKQPEKRLEPAHLCIYCRKTELDGIKLENEHIIPDGIGGDLVLQKGSCRACAKDINKWEQRVQTVNLGLTREVAGLKSRKKPNRVRERRFRVVASVFKDGEDPRDPNRGPQVTNLADLPQFVMTETTMGRPELLGGPIPNNGIRVFAAMRGGEQQEISVDFWAKGGDYLRLIAKVAHGFAAATIGLENFHPTLTDIILDNGHDPADIWKYIGMGRPAIARPDLHRVQLANSIAWVRKNIFMTQPVPVLVAYVQLFASFNAPIYEVVVGSKSGLP